MKDEKNTPKDLERCPEQVKHSRDEFEIVPLGKVTANTFGGGKVHEDNGVINSRS